MNNYDPVTMEPLSEEDNAAAESLKRQPSWASIATGSVPPMGPYQAPMSPPSTGNPGLDAQLARQASGFGDRNVPNYGAGESLGYLGQVGATLGELGTSSYSEALGLGSNPVLQEFTRPLNYMFGGANIIPAVTSNLGARAASYVADPYIDQLPEGVQGPARLAANVGGALLGGAAGVVGQGAAKRGAVALNAMGDEQALREAARFGEFGRGKYEDVIPRATYVEPGGRPTFPGASGGADDAYRGAHTAPGRETGAPLSDMTQMYPDDLYSADGARLYGGGYPAMEREAHSIMRTVRNNPDAQVTIYRAVPKGVDAATPNPGDWVTITRGYAKEHGERWLGGDYKIVSSKVRAGDLYTEGNSLLEFGYDPLPSPGAKPPAFPFGGARGGAFTPEEADALRAKIAAEGMTPENKAAFDAMSAEVFANAAPDAPSPMRPGGVGERIGQAITGEAATPEAPIDSVELLRQSITNAKPLQEQNAELLKQFRARQAGGFAGAASPGEGGFARAMSAMRGSADRVSFEPLRNAMEQPQIDDLYNRVMQSGLRPFEQANAGAALRDLMDGTVPTPSELAKLEEVMPGLTQALREAKIVSGPGIWEEIKAFAAIPQSLMSSLDLSGFRQTATAAYGHPIMAKDAFVKSLKSAASEDTFKALQDDLANRWYAPMRREAGVVLSEGEQSLTKAEGTLASKMLNNLVPGYRASQRAYATMLNEMRDGLFQKMVQDYGGDPTSISPEELKRWGKMINISTGRGVLPSGLAQSNVAGNPIFWAPRLLASRVEMPFELLSSSPQVRKEVARQLAAFVGVNTTILGLGKAAGIWDVETDPTSADFGQARIGQTRIDPWAGFRPIANLVARLATGERTSTTTGLTSDADAKKVVQDFLRQKFSPLTGKVTDIWTGQNTIGDPVEITTPGGAAKVAYESLTPLFLQNLADAVRRGEPGDVALATLGSLGLGVNTYEKTLRDYGYENLKPEEQVKYIKPQAWRLVQQNAPEQLKEQVGTGSFYDWFKAQEQQMNALVAERAPQLTEAERSRYALELVRKNPVYKAYLNARSRLTDQWVMDNPDLAKEMDDDMQDVPPSERQFVPTKRQRAVIGQ